MNNHEISIKYIKEAMRVEIEMRSEQDPIYAPDYNKQCCNCGASPVVAILEGERIVNELKMCGPCVFGDAVCIEPSEWN